MILYLLRHAEAVDRASSDADRRLTDKGREQAQRVGKFCKKQDIKPDVIVTSPLLRARETAGIVGELIDAPSTVSPALSSGMSPEAAMEVLKSFRKFESVMLVGHEPDFSSVTAFLLGAPNHDRFHLRKASLGCFRLRGFREGEGVLEFLVPVRLM